MDCPCDRLDDLIEENRKLKRQVTALEKRVEESIIAARGAMRGSSTPIVSLYRWGELDGHGHDRAKSWWKVFSNHKVIPFPEPMFTDEVTRKGTVYRYYDLAELRRWYDKLCAYHWDKYEKRLKRFKEAGWWEGLSEPQTPTVPRPSR